MNTQNNKADPGEDGNKILRHNFHSSNDDCFYYGLLGDITQFIEPQTEADPVAIYLQLIVTFGNYIGRKAFFEIDGAKHYTNLFANIVGDSSVSRKGTSGAHAKRVFIAADPFYNVQCVEGLSSGEGLIWHVRDDASILDKRCFVMRD